LSLRHSGNYDALEPPSEVYVQGPHMSARVPISGRDQVDRRAWGDVRNQRLREHEGARQADLFDKLGADHLCDSPGCAESANPPVS
jgi:hypothetical protein